MDAFPRQMSRVVSISDNREKKFARWREAFTVTLLRLVIVHHHFRPGGVRRIIEVALPHVVATWRRAVTEILLVGGEAPDPAWLQGVRRQSAGVRVRSVTDASLGYFSEQRCAPSAMARRMRAFLARRLGTGPDAADSVVWMHNPGLGRNLRLAAELGRLCTDRKIPLVMHHHDWWFDNRWVRWPEMRRSGFATLAAVSRAMLPAAPTIRHAAINQADAAILRRHFGARAGWIPNLATAGTPPPAARVRRARAWLRQRLGDDGPVWLMPCRLLRRKNFAEALLLTRWLRPEAWLVTTGRISSDDERGYAAQLEEAARCQGWRLRLGVLAGREPDRPAVSELLAASEAVLLTSLQEGFGLPNLEAVAAGRPLLARALPNVAPDLARFGFRFPQVYDEVHVDVRLFDLAAERRRQSQRERRWRAALPATVRAWAGRPALLAGAKGERGVAFSRLTLPAQLEVLAQPVERSWEWCAPLNPFLVRWKKRAVAGKLGVSAWPRAADRWLAGAAYARRLEELLAARPARRIDADAGVRTVQDFVRAKLAGENQYPLWWSSEP